MGNSNIIKKKILGRIVTEEKIFENTGPLFSGMYAAEEFLRSEGWVYGSTCAKSDLVGFHHPSIEITQKWHNYDERCKKLIAGVMQSSDYRNGSVKIIFFE
jgi:hypothetical protein